MSLNFVNGLQDLQRRRDRNSHAFSEIFVKACDVSICVLNGSYSQAHNKEILTSLLNSHGAP